MPQYDDTNRGVLFKNDKKQQDSHCDYSGSLNVGGQEFYLNAWIKESKQGNKFLSLSVKPKLQQRQDAPAPAKKSAKPENKWVEKTHDDDNSEIPF